MPKKPATRAVVVKVLVSVALASLVVANLFIAPRPGQLVFTDGEFTVAHQLQTERARWYLKWGYMWFPDTVGAIHFLCVADDSPHYRFIDGPWNLRGTEVVTDCEPLDFTNRPADQLHPNLITEDVERLKVFYAYDPSYEPQGDWAVLVEAQYNDYVMIHVATLNHLGLADITVPE